jgi:acyl-coenzyme A synthetase/AMP-(fatty) acid ligase
VLIGKNLPSELTCFAKIGWWIITDEHVVQRSQGAKVTADEIRAHLAGKIASWWMPDQITFLNEMPLNAVGKIDKKALRAELSTDPDQRMETSEKRDNRSNVALSTSAT